MPSELYEAENNTAPPQQSVATPAQQGNLRLSLPFHPALFHILMLWSFIYSRDERLYSYYCLFFQGAPEPGSGTVVHDQHGSTRKVPFKDQVVGTYSVLLAM